MISKISISNFGPIKEIKDFKFDNINLIIGHNGVGKTYLLKSLYVAQKCLEQYKRGKEFRSLNELLAEKLYWTFQADSVGNLVNKEASKLEFQMEGWNHYQFDFSFGSSTSKSISKVSSTFPQIQSNSIYLPPKEIVSLQNVITLSRSDNFKMFGFDDTYFDLSEAIRVASPKKEEPFNGIHIVDKIDLDKLNVSLEKHLDTIVGNISKSGKDYIEFTEIINKILINKLSVSNSTNITQEQIDKSVKELFAPITKEKIKENISIQFLTKYFKDNYNSSLSQFGPIRQELQQALSGRIEYDTTKDEWYFQDLNRRKYEINITAEGIKKLSVLDVLFANHYLSKNSIIFIDEPESALHPELISKFMDVIFHLSQLGIQFIIASHSYFVIKKLYLLSQQNNCSIPLIAAEDDDQWNAYNLKDGMPENPIIQESIALYKEEVML